MTQRIAALSGYCFTALAILGARPAAADRVITEDGRIVTPQKARKEGDGYRLVFRHGEILLPDESRIQSIEIEGDMSDYVPKNDDEKQKLEQGYVRYRGKWLTKSRYENELKKQFEAARERSDFLAEHADWHNCWIEETKHFIVKTNTSPELLEYYADLLEAYYKLMDKRIGIKPTPTLRRAKMTVSVYKSHDEFFELAQPSARTVLGFFNSGEQTLNFFHNFAEPSRTEWVALHECTHLLTYLIDDQFRPQIWINEACADYFGSSKITRDKRGRLVIEPGQLQTDRVLTVQQAIKDGNDVKLEDLFFLEKSEFQGFQYAHAWSFVYFLNNYEDGKYSKGFNKFFKDLYTTAKGVKFHSIPSYGKSGTGKQVKPEDIQALLLSKIKVKDLDLLEQQWKEFIAAVPIESRDARLKRGLIAVRRGDFDAGIKDLEAAIDAGTEDPRAWASLARAKVFSGGRKKALEHLRTAIDMDPLNAAYRYELSLMMSGISSTGGFGGGVKVGADKQPSDPLAKAQAGLATELDPENDAYKEWYDSFE